MATNQEGLTLNCVKKTLMKSTRILCDNLRVNDMLLTLIAEGAITTNDATKIRRKDIDTEKVEELLDILARSPVASYNVFMRALKEDRPDLYKDVKAIEEQESGVSSRSTSGRTQTTSASSDSREQKISNQDIFKITVKAGLTKANLDLLFMALDISTADIDNGRLNANTNDFKLQSSQILRDGWLQKKGRAATRQVILDALADIEAMEAVEYLKSVW